ncbi:Wzz/FepE/Etk N-terminal domain-containing protein [Variibacter gotjawalensis]|uniref:Wzz/FepE/Etk N-terminal domain-containing protein n=1 Tax=Variibacter gotjawalensis TaxID=1333996 RepID=UPI0013EED2DA|nr:Wzz/FepE/Etk N-terminal domain-containing protein [Variibacter gotjawalensis]
MREILAFVRSNISIIAASITVCTLLAIFYLLMATPIYSADASVLIETSRGFNTPNEAVRTDLMTDQARVENQMEIIKSHRVAQVVIAKLQLESNDEFSTSPTSISLLFQSIAKIFSGEPTAEELARERKKQSRRVQARFIERMAVRRIGQSLVMEVAFLSRSPELAAEVANEIADAYVRDIVNDRSELARRRTEWLSERLDLLQKQTFDAQRAVERFKLLGDTGPAADIRAKLAELESVSQSYRRMYDGFLQQYAETSQRVSYPEPDAKIVSQAEIPLRKTHPRSILILAFSLFLGVASGTGIALVRSTMKRSVGAPKQIPEQIGVPCLGVTSDIGGAISRNRVRIPSPPWLASVPWLAKAPWFALPPAPTGLSLSSMGDMNFALSRQLREVKASINALTLRQSSLCIGVVSPRSGSGATTVAAGLAYLYANSGKKTLLIDACNNTSRLSRELSNGDQVGLMQAMRSTDAWTQVLERETTLPFRLLPRGDQRDGDSPADRFGAKDSSFQRMREEFEVVIVDLPSLSTSSDARTIGSYLDGVVVVADFASTTIDKLTSAVGELHEARSDVLGVVLNKVDENRRVRWRM